MKPQCLFVFSVLALASSLLAQGPYDAAFIPEAEYQQTFFVTPNGDPNHSGPMILEMLGGGDAVMGGGEYAKVGVVAGIYYARMTEGASDDYRFYITKGPKRRSLPLPPDVTDLSQLPSIVTDGLADWATSPSLIPRTIAGLEWARYYDVPISFQLHTIVSHGGTFGDEDIDINIYFETMGKDQCMWDVSDICDPDDDPATIDNAGASWGGFSFATPTLADPVLGAQMGYDLRFQAYVKRNLQDGLRQTMEIASHPRYAGHIAGFAIDPEIHYPAHDNGTPIPQHADYGGGTVVRPFLEDYHPVMCRQFAYYLRDRYGDATPLNDTNGDGVTFWGDFGTDYVNSGGFGHDHSTPPATWEDIDPPRKYPRTKSSVRTAYWQEWCNFRVEVMNDFLDRLVTWTIEGGVPPTRMFTHQTMANASYNENRAQWDNADWLDDWSHMETPGGYSGFSQYQPYGVNGYHNGKHYYENLYRRDEGFGAPEYNPMVIGAGGPWATPSEVRNCVRTAWDKRAHILWAHSWGSASHPAYDCYTTAWDQDPATRGPVGWTLVNFDPHPTSDTRLIATTTGNSYMESPTLSLDASQYTYLVAIMHPALARGQQMGEMRVDFQTQGDPTWKTVTEDIVRHQPYGTKAFPIHMASHPGWTGTVTRLRFHPIPTQDSNVYVKQLIAARPNALTSEFASLISDKKDTPRPALPSPVDVAAPMDLAASIATFSPSGNFTFYGTDQDSQLNQPNVFFYEDAVTCGGVSKTGIVAYAPYHLGLRKTGKYRRLRLPSNSEITLSFFVGIRDGYSSTDGVRFRVYLRDEGRMLHNLFLKEWRWNQWTPKQAVDLTPYSGQVVDLFFETQGIAKTSGDASVWGEPLITAAPIVSGLTIKTESGQTLAKFDRYGNLELTGALLENTIPRGTANSDFLVKSLGGATVAGIYTTGDLALAGSAHESQTSLAPPAGSLVIKNDVGEVVAYISPYGDLLLKGTVTSGP